ncbi:MAG: HEPN domain-containing protein [Bacteroidales bacterium]|nr:HEPN domain-containing protein [Bacteroidales bacterium]
MKDSLSSQDRHALIQWRLEKADNLMIVSRSLMDMEQYNSAMNRVYYAVFSAACALLLSHKIGPQTHNGVYQMLSLHFVREGKIDKVHLSHYSQILSARQKADYDDYVEYDQDTAELYYRYAQEIIEAFRNALL